MSDRTKQTLIIIAGITAAILIVLFAFAVYQGIATIPAELQTAIIGLLVAAIGAGSVYLNTRSNAATRQNSDRNAAETQAKIETLHSTVQQQADVVAAKVAEVTTQPTLQEIASNTAQIAENTEGMTP